MDKWLCDQPLAAVCSSSLSRESLIVTVDELWCPRLGWKMDQLGRLLPASVLGDLQKNSLFDVEDNQDQPVWYLTTLGHFLVRST